MTIAAGPTDCSSGLAKRIFDNLRYDNPWKASQGGYVVGVLGCPLTLNGYGYSVSAVTTGITGPTEPTWPLVVGNTVVDGGVTWTCDVACGPSGKGLNYQGVLAASDLNALRVLACDTSRAVADSLTTDKVDVATQTGGGCVAIYNTSAGQSLPLGTSTTINYSTKEADTDNAVTVGASWVFTCPAGKGGYYSVTASAGFTATGASTTDVMLQCFKNAVEIQRGNRLVAPASPNVTYLVLAGLAQLAAGDTLHIQMYTGSATETTEAYAATNRVSIHRITGV
jgi:hypothetical protein